MKRSVALLILTFVLVVLLLSGCGSSKSSAPAPTSPPTPEPLSFVLQPKVVGEYGEEKTINAGTDTAYTFIWFKIPSGTYEVKNESQKGGCQISLYTGITSDGNSEEFTISDTRPIVLMAGNSSELTVKDGEYVKLADGDDIVRFTLK